MTLSKRKLSLFPIFIFCLILSFILGDISVKAEEKESENKDMSTSVSKQFTILNGKIISTVTRSRPLPFNAIVKEVLVKPGQKVIKDEVLMTYTLTEEAERTLQKELINGAGTEDIKAQILTLQSQLSNLKSESNKARQLAAAGLGSNQASARSAGEVRRVEDRIHLMRQNLKKREESFTKRLEELSSYFGKPVKLAAELPTELMLTTPMEGHVLSVATNAETGAQLGQGFTPILVGKMDPMSIQVQVYENEVGRLKVGDTASVTIPSLSDKVFEARVCQIDWTSSNLDVAQPSYFTVELMVPNPNLELKPGFKAIVKFSDN